MTCGAVLLKAHYTYLKSARGCGLGSDNLVAVPCDAGGAMLPAGATHLKMCRGRGHEMLTCYAVRLLCVTWSPFAAVPAHLA